MLAVVMVIAPLMALAQTRAREARPTNQSERSRGTVEVINDWRDDVNLSMWTDQRQRIGEWSIRPGEQVVLQESGESVRARPNYKIKAGQDWGWVNIEQVGQFRNGTWYVNVRDIWQATHANRRDDQQQSYRDQEESAREREARQRRSDSPVDQVLRRFNIE